jgi:recombinational DNA repair ATPase RecF
VKTSDGGLRDLVFERVIADQAVSDPVEELVVAAVDGDAALHAVLARTPATIGNEDEEEAEIGRLDEIFLRSIRLQGFRGVGPKAVVDLEPGPGLTVITGRNGSGKSSFAEAAELALTGANSRWTEKQNNKPLWLGGWRNLHAIGPTEIAVDLISAGEKGTTTVRTSWADGATLDSATWTVQRPGQKREPLGGGRGLPGSQVYRPFLSYGELGAVVDKRPTDLFKALHSLLGLHLLEEASERLKSARAPLDARTKAIQTSKNTLVGELRSIDDPRARRAESLLAGSTVDLESIAELALGSDDDTQAIAGLRALAALTLPTAEEVAQACASVREKLERVAAASTADAVSSATVVSLLEAALTHQAEHGEEQCPVCRAGTLDKRWREGTEVEVERLRGAARDLYTAHEELRAAVGGARRLASPVPPALIDMERPDILDVRSAWEAWEAASRVAPEQFADAVQAAHTALAHALGRNQVSVRAELARLDEVWRPTAARLWAWYEQAVASATDATTIAHLRAAETWLKKATITISNERFTPFAAQTQDIWQKLRQESNVELGGVTLAGTGNQRKVVLDVSVDGSSTSALSVMSQGELHALGLALFLPRATRDESPFRFLVIDDPVQAMDPAKVDGLARVLSDIARSRQVVVFSHDDRLADAVRRLPEPARIHEVQRRERSHVAVVESSDPVSRYLSDASAVARDDELPDDIRRAVIANCCRGAIEAASHAKVRRVRLGRGDPHVDVDAALTKAVTTHAKLALALFDNADRGGDLYARLNKELGRWAGDVLRMCKEGAHGLPAGDMSRIISDTQRLTMWMQR